MPLLFFAQGQIDNCSWAYDEGDSERLGLIKKEGL